MNYKDLSFAHGWGLYEENLIFEYQQCVDEGKDIEHLNPLITAVSGMPRSIEKQKLGQQLFEMISELPQRTDYPFNEPSDYEKIKAVRPEKRTTLIPPVKDEALKSKIHGAWLGRICGCYLGKPVEGMQTPALKELLKAEDNYPLRRYIGKSEKLIKHYGLSENTCWAYKKTGYMPPDDDTNYTVMAAKRIVGRYGRDFTSTDIAKTWLDSQPMTAYCTAEHVAYINFVNSIAPPLSAVYQNPFREWIGAQIRGDYFGYINPGDPELAARMAYRDASISHVKNGIYGEMFISAAIAAAAVTSDPLTIIMAGLEQIPEESRLSSEIRQVINLWRNETSQDECFAFIHKNWNESSFHHWCHTISNAMIVCASLLYGDMDYGRSICMAVEAGFDTDCNGATVGSIVGMALGKEGIGSEWSDTIQNTVDTTIIGCGMYKIDELVDITMEHII